MNKLIKLLISRKNFFLSKGLKDLPDRETPFVSDLPVQTPPLGIIHPFITNHNQKGRQAGHQPNVADVGIILPAEVQLNHAHVGKG